MKCRLDWRTDFRGEANSYGYHTHNSKMREACVQRGVELNEDAKVAVKVVPAHLFTPVEGKFNVLFTAWEFEKLTPRQIEGASKADLVVVTAEFLRGPFATAGRPVAVVNLGVERPPFVGDPHVERRLNRLAGNDFRWLWCAAPNLRKGWDLLTEAWKGLSFLVQRKPELYPSCQLYVKTTVPDWPGSPPEGILAVRSPGLLPMLVDTRNVKRLEYWGLFRSASAFVYPTRGEGFGLTLAEALACGLPSVYTPTTGVLDFAMGFPMEIERGWVELAEKIRMPCAVPKVESMIGKMVEVMLDYDEALKVGSRASERMKEFSWRRSADRFLEAIRQAGGFSNGDSASE